MAKPNQQKQFPKQNYETFLVKPLYAKRHSKTDTKVMSSITGSRQPTTLRNMKSNVTFLDERIDKRENHRYETTQTSNGHALNEVKEQRTSTNKFALTKITFREKDNELNILEQRDICNLPGVCAGALAYDEKCQRRDVRAPGVSSFNTGKVVAENGRKKGSFKKIGGMSNEIVSGQENMGSAREAPKDKTVQNVMGVPADGWLRIWPAELSRKRGLNSIIVRCIFCQVGLFTFIFFWSLLGALAISMTEGPHEVAITTHFKKKQEELIIYLSTELRLLDKQHPHWVETVARRLEEERVLTTSAVLNGARSGPGLFWDYPGSFLFVVYVLTALGFGAPVPHTWAGRSATIVFAAVGIPLHVLLVMNAGGALAWQIRSCANRGDKWRQQQKEAPKFNDNLLDNRKSAPGLMDDDDAVEEAKSKSSCLKLKCSNFGKKIMRCLSLPWSAQGMPLLIVIYYIFGALVFGVARRKDALDILMFPLEFTTTGGLEREIYGTGGEVAINTLGVFKVCTVESAVRILYAIYLESAIFLVSSIIYAMRSTTTNFISTFTIKHDLYYKINT